MAKNALVRQLEATYKNLCLDDYPDLYINTGIECCGVSEICNIDSIKKGLSTRLVHAMLVNMIVEEGGTAGIMICTSTTGRKPQLERLGFKLVRKEPFVNANTGNKIYMYQILGKDIDPSTEVRKKYYA